MTFQPLIIIPVILNNSFTLEIVGIICFVVSLVLYGIFNLKGLGEKYRVLSSLYLLPIFASIIMYYVNDEDLSTWAKKQKMIEFAYSFKRGLQLKIKSTYLSLVKNWKWQRAAHSFIFITIFLWPWRDFTFWNILIRN